MDSLPAPCPGDHWPRGCGDGSAAAPSPGRCASCCPPARRRRWPRARWPCAATPRPSSTPRRCAWRPWCPPSGAAAAATPRSPTCCADSRPPGTARASGSSTTRAATRPRARPRPRGSSRSSSGRSRARCASASRAGRAPTWRWPPAGRPSRRSCGCRARAPAPTWSRTTSPSSTPPRPSANGPRGPTGRGFTASPPRRGWPTWCARATAPARRASTSASTTTRYRPADVERRSRPRALLRARRHAAAGGAAGPAGAGRAAPPPAGDRDRALRRGAPAGGAVSAPRPGRARARRAGAGVLRGDRRPRAVAHQPVAHPPGDAGLRPARASTWPARACSPPTAPTGPATLAAPEPIALCEAIEALLDDPRAARPPGRRGAALGRRRARGRPLRPRCEAGLRAAVREAAQP